MLTKINYIKGTGLFEDCGPSPNFTRASLIFGDNGRGKSTLAAVLRSASGDSTGNIATRRTLGNQVTQALSIQIQPQSTAQLLEYQSGSWTTTWADIVVFDADFVSRNVYAGHGISPDQRAGLLTFAVGETAVTTKKTLDDVTAQSNAANATARVKEAALTQARGPYTVKQYRALPNDANIQEKIDGLRQTLAQAKDLAKVKSTPGAQALPLPQLDLDALFVILRRSVGDISEAAANRVKAHIAKHNSENFEGWLATGLNFVTDDSCPFCGLVDAEQALISSYRSYFDDEYHSLKEQASALPKQVTARLGEQVAEIAKGNAQRASAQLAYWRTILTLPETNFDDHQYGNDLAVLHDFLLKLAERKSKSPLEVVGTEEELKEAGELLLKLKSRISTHNGTLAQCNDAIGLHKQSLEAAQPIEIEQQIKKLEIQKERHTPGAVTLLGEFDAAELIRSELAKKKDAARDALAEQMNSIFDDYGKKINQLLQEFGTQVEIRSLKPSYRGQGGLGRTEYELAVRGTPISLTATDGAYFGNTLSEGDKRALAYSFFLAKLMATPDLSQKVVVVDDPVCSLDWNRRASTIRTLLRLAKSCRQLIVLAHDAYFIRLLGENLEKMKETKGAVSYIKVATAAGNASILTDFNVAEECKSRHLRNIDVLAAYASNPSSGSAILASKTIRPVLEGYLRYRFPLSPPQGNMLGNVINEIDKSEQGSPYFALKPLVSEFNDINNFTIQFMHEDGDTAAPMLVESEVLNYCNRVLALLNK